MKIALTRGASGIGAAVASKMKELGHSVTSFDIAEPKGVEKWIETDLSDATSITRALAQAEGPYDALINNAGLPPREGMAERVLQVNWFGFSHFLDGMLGKLSEGAAIVDVASRAGAIWRDNLSQPLRHSRRALSRFSGMSRHFGDA